MQLERALLPEALKALKKFEGVATELEADGVKENRLQNLAITLDKLAFFLRHQPAERIHQPPLRVLTEAEILESLWTGPESIWKRASQVATTHLRSARGASGGRIDPAEVCFSCNGGQWRPLRAGFGCWICLESAMRTWGEDHCNHGEIMCVVFREICAKKPIVESKIRLLNVATF